MGNCCGGESSDNFKGDGRTLNAQPANASTQPHNARAPAPAKISGPQGGRTLGKNPQVPGDSADPKAAAARAAEVRSLSSTTSGTPMLGDVSERRDRGGRMVATAWERAKAGAQGKGKLGKQLDARRGQSQANALAQTARDNVAARDADAAAQARSYN
ncbi:hypothetical protein B0A55_08642 [Friedmanniomyces simplex]|uniref:Uncharacterized protein n=1 Tax=Friedmanniomyces simplex TaxID=329884 RepID=A0A4U0WWQ0_9PEZI|nr:hypothetical protein B0A55_08642 [Friedmanniomyces simplex]